MADEPDDLGRASFVDIVAGRLDQVALGQDSTVFGLVGQWGSGKTTLIASIESRLGDGWKVARFSPWATSDPQGLTAEFIAALQAVLKADNSAASREARTEIAKYSKLVVPWLRLIPMAGGAAAAAAAALVDEVTKAPPWHEQFSLLAKQLAKLGHRVLIVADDIDRLDVAELMALLRVVRLLGRFPNVHYLLAYDQATVEHLLSSHGASGTSSSFMEKIVQVPFEVPPIAEAKRRRLASDCFNQVFAFSNWNLSDEEANQRASSLLTIVVDGLATPRAHARFAEQLLVYAEKLDFREIDVLDFIALTFLRVFHHRLWEQLPASKDALIAGYRRVTIDGSGTVSEQEWETLVTTNVDHGDPRVPFRVLSFLFPSVKVDGESGHVAHKRAFSSPEYFERHLILDVSEGDVRDHLAHNALEELSRDAPDVSAARLATLLDAEDSDLARLAYAKVLRERTHPATTTTSYLAYLHERLAARPGEEPSFDSPSSSLWRWFANEAFASLEGNAETATWFEEHLTLGELLTLLWSIRSLSFRRNESLVVLAKFAPRLEGMIADEDSALFSQTGPLRMVCSLLKVTERPISGLLDAYVGDSLEKYLQVGDAFTYVQNWVGSSGVSPELGFDGELFEQVVSSHVREGLADELPGLGPETIDPEDISRENRSNYTLAQISQRSRPSSG